MIRFSLPFQKSHILVKQILHCLCTPPCPKPCQRCMIRHRLFFQKPHEVHTVPAGLLQLSAGIDSALVSVRHYLEQHSRIDLRFSASGRIGAIQFPGRTTQACCDLRLLPVVWQVQNEVSYKMTLSQRATARRDGGLFIRGYVLRDTPRRGMP